MKLSRNNLIIIGVLLSLIIGAVAVYALQPETAQDDPPKTSGQSESEEPTISEARAKQLQSEADALTAKNPLEAKKKYEEAAATYEKIGNSSKVFEMENSVRVIELSTGKDTTQSQEKHLEFTAGSKQSQ